MNVCLIGAATATEFTKRQLTKSDALRAIVEHPPVGILVLAAVLEHAGFGISIVDLNRVYLDYIRQNPPGRDAANFISSLVQMLAGTSADVFGFGTLCSSYALTLRIAERLRLARPGVPIVLGGPHASAVDTATLEVTSAVDYIVRGEAEESFPWLLDAIRGGDQPEAIPGITWRGRGGIVRNPDAPLIADLDRIPAPAYRYWPFLDGWPEVPLEYGRGCPYGCTFCSTSRFFRRAYRSKSPEVLLSEMASIRDQYGSNSFNLLHDSFTADRRRAAEFCEAMAGSGTDFRWCSSARTDCLDDDLIQRLARSGCRGLFLGVETGAPYLQKLIHKNLDLTEARRRIRQLAAAGIPCMVSLIIGFPEETEASIGQTVGFLADSLRHEGVEAQLHILAPLPGTPIHKHYGDALRLDSECSDITSQSARRNPADLALIKTYPDLFPNYYYVPTPHVDRHLIVELREFIVVLMNSFRCLLLGLHQDENNLLLLFQAYASWRCARMGTERGKIHFRNRYFADQFHQDFLQFLLSDYIPGRKRNGQILSALAKCDWHRLALRKLKSRTNPPPPAVIRTTDIPIIAHGVSVFEAGVDLRQLHRCLRGKKTLASVPRRNTVIALRAIPDAIEQIQLTPSSARLIHLCDGSRTIDNILQLVSARQKTMSGFPASQAVAFGLRSLLDQHLIILAPHAGNKGRSPVLKKKKPVGFHVFQSVASAKPAP